MRTNNEQRTQELYNKFLKLIENNPNGFTATAQGDKLNLNKGYAVAVTNNKGTDAQQLISKVLNLNKKLNFNVGGWVDNKTNEFYLDLTIIEPSLIVAQSIAKEFSQKAIFDFNTFTEIRV